MTQPAVSRRAPTGPQPAAGHQVEPPEFEQVMKGYDTRQVDGWVNRAREEIARLAHDAAHAGSELYQAIESNPAAKRSVEEIMQLALDEITGQKAAAAAEVSKMLSDAQLNASQVMAGAQREAASLTAGAREQAATVLADARAQAKDQLDAASAHASAVTEGAQHRLSVLAQMHEDGMRRLSQVQQVTAELVASEQERGSLADEVARIAGTPL